MRYRIQPATAGDVAFIATMILEEETTSTSKAPEGSAAVDKLLQSCASSTQLWAARDAAGTPAALWGVMPSPQQPQTGRMWMMLVESGTDEQQELAGSSRLVMSEMLTEFGELENIVAADSVEAINFLRQLGFRLGPPLPLQAGAPLHRRAWFDAEDGAALMAEPGVLN